MQLWRTANSLATAPLIGEEQRCQKVGEERDGSVNTRQRKYCRSSDSQCLIEDCYKMC